MRNLRIELDTTWGPTLRDYCAVIGRAPFQVIYRALFYYWRMEFERHPDSVEGRAAKYALDTLLTK